MQVRALRDRCWPERHVDFCSAGNTRDQDVKIRVWAEKCLYIDTGNKRVCSVPREQDKQDTN